MPDQDGQGRPATLSIRFGYPEAAFLYKQARPRLRIDGADVPVPGWGAHRVPVPPGRHTVQVWVPYTLPRRAGKARAEVTVPPGGETRLEYLAPTLTFRGGSLGRPGEQASAGYSAIMIINVLAIIAVVVLLAVALALN